MFPALRPRAAAAASMRSVSWRIFNTKTFTVQRRDEWEEVGQVGVADQFLTANFTQIIFYSRYNSSSTNDNDNGNNNWIFFCHSNVYCVQIFAAISILRAVMEGTNLTSCNLEVERLNPL